MQTLDKLEFWILVAQDHVLPSWLLGIEWHMSHLYGMAWHAHDHPLLQTYACNFVKSCMSFCILVISLTCMLHAICMLFCNLVIALHACNIYVSSLLRIHLQTTTPIVRKPEGKIALCQ